MFFSTRNKNSFKNNVLNAINVWRISLEKNRRLAIGFEQSIYLFFLSSVKSNLMRIRESDKFEVFLFCITTYFNSQRFPVLQSTSHVCCFLDDFTKKKKKISRYRVSYRVDHEMITVSRYTENIKIIFLEQLIKLNEILKLLFYNLYVFFFFKENKGFYYANVRFSL